MNDKQHKILVIALGVGGIAAAWYFSRNRGASESNKSEGEYKISSPSPAVVPIPALLANNTQRSNATSTPIVNTQSPPVNQSPIPSITHTPASIAAALGLTPTGHANSPYAFTGNTYGQGFSNPFEIHSYVFASPSQVIPNLRNNLAPYRSDVDAILQQAQAKLSAAGIS